MLGGSGGMPPENFEILNATYALRCVLRTYKAPFSCMHTVYIHTLKLVPSLSGFRNMCGALADYAVAFIEWFQKYMWGPSGLCSSLH